jgi:hypothetical protein
MSTPSLFKLIEVEKLIKSLLMVALSAGILLTLGCSPKQIVNAELAELAKQDQLDRSQGAFNMAKDSSRLKRVQELENSDSLQHPLDFYHAALIYQHGTEPLHYLKAYLLSEEALKRDPTLVKAKSLNCAADDRYRLSVGKAQVWGTQYVVKSDNKVEIQEPFHPWVKTDKERESCR